MPAFTDRIMHAWNAFTGRDPTINRGNSSSFRPDRPRFTRGAERSIVNSVFNRIALDCSAIQLEHIKLDENNRMVEVINDGLNNCLTVEANIDQTGRAFVQDIVMSMLDEGCVAVVPVITNISAITNNSYEIETMRTGKIIEWTPDQVKIKMYNDDTGQHGELWMPKKSVAIVENPLYSVINEPNSTMQRLIHKLSLLDYVDEQSSSGKLDLIIQLPYVIKTEARRKQAEQRRKDIEMQLAGSKYGIAYTDGTEHITQLNRSLENNLVSQIENLTRTLYSQLGITEEIMNGTADEKVMNNYFNRTVEPILSSIADEMKRKFLTKTARTQKHSIAFFRDPFKLVPINELAELADKLTRNEIMTSNEFRQVIGLKPVQNDPKADMLQNSNMPMQDQQIIPQEEQLDTEGYQENTEQLDDVDNQLDELESQLNHGDSFLLDDELMHYTSKYYDPVKAHEYYEEYTKKHKLKGREKNGETEYSTSMLNDEGKMAYKQIKEKINAEKKSRTEQISASAKAETEASKNNMQSQLSAKKNEMTEQIKQYSDKTAQEITGLREKIDKYKKDKNAGGLNFLQNKIASLREANAKQRAALNETYKAESESIRSEHQSKTKSIQESSKGQRAALVEEYKNKHKEELKKLIDSGEFKKVSKKKSKKKKA